MELDYKNLFSELKQYLTDELNDATEMRELQNGRIGMVSNILSFIERYQEDHENAESNIAKTTDTTDKVKLSDEPDRDSRPRMRTVIVDGTGYNFRNAKEMLTVFGAMHYYKTFCHLVQYKGGRENIVEMEADALRRLLIQQGKHLDSYTAHALDGFAKTITFDNETEGKNA